MGNKIQNEIKKIITKYQQTIIENKAWDYYIINKTTIITSIHGIMEETQKEKALKSLKHIVLERILTSLQDLQKARKNLVALHKERVPRSQWTLIYLLIIILFISLSLISSQNSILEFLLKATFGSSIVAVLILLYHFDRLKFFEKTIGEKTSKDVLETIAGKK